MRAPTAARPINPNKISFVLLPPEVWTEAEDVMLSVALGLAGVAIPFALPVVGTADAVAFSETGLPEVTGFTGPIGELFWADAGSGREDSLITAWMGVSATGTFVGVAFPAALISCILLSNPISLRASVSF